LQERWHKHTCSADLQNNMPEDKLDVLRKFQDQVESIIEQQMPPAMPPAMPAEPLASGQDMTALGVPEAPPVSDLMPQG